MEQHLQSRHWTQTTSHRIAHMNIKLQGKTEEEKMAILRPYNQQLVAAGFAAIDPREVSMLDTLINNRSFSYPVKKIDLKEMVKKSRK
jgi:hypothetical protein